MVLIEINKNLYAHQRKHIHTTEIFVFYSEFICHEISKSIFTQHKNMKVHINLDINQTRPSYENVGQ